MTGVALVTGGSQGIGLGISLALKVAGFDVAVAALPGAQAPEGMAFFPADIADVAGAKALVDRIEATCGPISCLVSNAGVPARVRGDVLDVTPENFDFTLGVNLRGTFFLAREVARRMIARAVGPYRSMIFVTSVSAEMVSVERAEYCISKAGVSMMVKLFAARMAAAGVAGKYDAAIVGGLVPAGRWGQPEDIGRIVVPMATGAMAFATGAVVPVDGGLSIPRF